MRAAVIRESHEVSVVSVEDPTPGPREVVVDVAACGICGTDLHILDGEFAPSLPIVPGHEFAGVVVATGTEVRELAGGPGRVDQVFVGHLVRREVVELDLRRRHGRDD